MEKSFRQSVLDVVKHIPVGKTLTYKEVATLSGSPRAFRAVGNILNKNYNPNIPCHRVLRSDGGMGGYNRGVERKRALLEEERKLAANLPKGSFTGTIEESRNTAEVFLV